MLRFLGQKIKNRKWLMLCLFIGNLLLISVVCCISMYSDAIRSRMLERKMNAAMDENGEYPMKLNLNATLVVVSQTNNTASDFLLMESYAEGFAEDTKAKINELVEVYTTSSKADADILRNKKKLTLSLQIGAIRNMDKHIEIVDGKGYETAVEDGIYNVIVSEKFLASQKLVVGETLTMKSLYNEDGSNLKVRIAGAFAAKDLSEDFWVKKPGEYENVMFMDKETFDLLFTNFDAPEVNIRGLWYLLFDYNDTTREEIESITERTKFLASVCEQHTSLTLSENYTELLETFLSEDNQTENTLRILQAPILVLLLAFIVMVSRQTLSLETGEIAVLKSRGAGRFQIIRLYICQSLMLGLAAVIPGVLLGAFLCQVLGSANAFMEFVGRSALNIRFFRPEILIDCIVSVLFATFATVIPVIKFSKGTTVSQRQTRRGKRTGIPFWQRFGLDFVILAIGLYGWYSFRGSEEALAAQVLEGKSVNIFLYFSSVVFMLGAGLVITRLVHIIPKIVYLIGKKFFGPASYAAFTRIMRSGKEQNFIIVFLVLTIALGIYNADTARTINANDEMNVNFLGGADVVLMERWTDNSELVSRDTTGGIQQSYIEPEISKFLEIEGVESVAKVYKGQAMTSVAGYEYEVILVGIDTKEFGETANMPDGILAEDWYSLLNAMASNPSGVLLSSSVREASNLQIGDSFYYSPNGTQIKGTVMGYIDYFPGISPTYDYHDSWSNRDYKINSIFIIANLATIQTATGISPYYVYLKTNGDASHIYEYIEDNNLDIRSFTDSTITIVDHKNDALLQGTNGMLTVGFLIVLLLCIIGFLIFWILSIKQRTLQLGVFRAMGVTMGEIVHMLIDEQIFITGISAVCGALVGKVASKLFIPLIQIAYTRTDSVLPLQVISSSSDTTEILATVFVLIIACIITLGIYISKTGIAQALKLGEDS
ncbi:MAG: FtsX-like permease family protein [Lachnospiraceae bacterium]|nr:FtsX-like permease family protein [Lachnospiraceae bacterium]